jgi:colicin import membrane protein
MMRRAGGPAPPTDTAAGGARLGPVGKSLLLHGVVVMVLAAGLWWPRSDPPMPQPLAIEAVVVDQATLEPRRGPPRPRPEPAPPQPVAEPQPEPERPPEPVPPQPSDAERQREQQQRIERENRERRAAEQRAAAQRASEQAAADKAAAERRAAEKLAADRKLAAEKAAADQRAAAEDKLRAQREAELRQQLAAEENAQRARAAGQGAAWAAAIQARIQRAWIRPDSARPGLDCTVIVNQVPGGEVTGVRIGACNGDDVVRQSIEAAVYRASPLPSPPDPALFERTLEVRFRPNE